MKPQKATCVVREREVRDTAVVTCIEVIGSQATVIGDHTLGTGIYVEYTNGSKVISIMIDSDEITLNVISEDREPLDIGGYICSNLSYKSCSRTLTTSKVGSR